MKDMIDRLWRAIEADDDNEAEWILNRLRHALGPYDTDVCRAIQILDFLNRPFADS